MIQSTIIKYLQNELNIPTYAEKPTTKANEYIVVEVLRTERNNLIDAVSVDIHSYSSTLLKASKLNDKVRKAMYDIVSINNISSSRLGGGGQDIDTATKAYSYDSIFNLVYTEE